MNSNHPMVSIIERGNATPEWYQCQFDKHDFSGFDYIYISLGSKFNRTHIEYLLPYNRSVVKYSNADFQILPAFYRNKPDKKTLSICIDRFENADIKDKNIEIVSNIHQTEQNIKFILCDLDGTIQLFEMLIQYIIDKLISLQETNLMIANYLRFVSPNHTEYYLEQNLSNAIDKLLSKTPFRSCFYQWFGYQPNTYNFIYKYQEQFMTYGVYFLCEILEKLLDIEELTIYNKDDVRKLITCPKQRNIYDMFLKHSLDICHTDAYFIHS